MLKLALLLLTSSLTLPAYAIPNPSAKTCTGQGGTYEVYESDAGQDGYCAFDRARIGAWTLHSHLEAARGGGHPPLAIEAYLNPVRPMGTLALMPNPAAVYCEQSGAKVEILKDRAGNEHGVCRFGDESVIEEWTLFRGPEAETNAALTRVLKRAR